MTGKVDLQNEAILKDGKVIRRRVAIPSQGVQLLGWLYLPAELSRAASPAIVMANALTAVKEITLPGYAERFAEAGFVSLVFDYRFWGESEGEPRNQIIPYGCIKTFAMPSLGCRCSRKLTRIA